jgi:hypothetical protein
MLETKQSFKEGVSPIPNTPPAPSAIHGSCKTIQYMDTTSCDRHLLEWSAGWTNHSKECKSQYCGSRKTQLMWQNKPVHLCFRKASHTTIYDIGNPLCVVPGVAYSHYIQYILENSCALCHRFNMHLQSKVYLQGDPICVAYYQYHFGGNP